MEQSDKKESIGLALPLFAKAVEMTFSKSAERDLFSFVNQYDRLAESRWYIASDYCIGDPKKQNDVLVFSLFPYLTSIKMMEAYVGLTLPRDLKQEPNPTQKMADALTRVPGFHIAFLMPRDFTFSPDTKDEHATMVCILKTYIDALDTWGDVSTDADAIKLCREHKSKAERFMHKLTSHPVPAWTSSNGRHLLKMRNALTIIILYAFIATRLLAWSPNAKLCWLPDRDATIAWPNAKSKKAFYMVAYAYVHVWLQSQHGATLKPNQLAFAIPDDEGTNWYDFINRFPDYIVGTLAQLNLRTGETKDRLYPLLRELIADNPNLAIIRIMGPTQAQRVTVNRRHP